MPKFKQVLVKQGETISYYAPTLGSRNSTTNRKVLTWSNAVDITAVVRSQPSSVENRNEGVRDIESLIILTETALAKHGVIKWANKYYNILLVESIYWNTILEYYKSRCSKRLEYLGS